MTWKMEVRVGFEDEYTYYPIITITPKNFIEGQYGITDISTSDFSIELSQEQKLDIQFDWHTFGSDEGSLSVSDSSIEEIEIVSNTALNKDESEDTVTETENEESIEGPENKYRITHKQMQMI